MSADLESVATSQLPKNICLAQADLQPGFFCFSDSRKFAAKRVDGSSNR
jgi:hypothetical protein